jgi:hypothetical protein
MSLGKPAGELVSNPCRGGDVGATRHVVGEVGPMLGAPDVI